MTRNGAGTTWVHIGRAAMAILLVRLTAATEVGVARTRRSLKTV
jgi:hypothetical protein